MRKQDKINTVINGQEVTVEQDSQTGQFFTRQNIGNIPVDYDDYQRQGEHRPVHQILASTPRVFAG